MNKTIGIVLIIAAVVFGVLAFRAHDENSADVKIGDLELSAEKKNDSTETTYWIIGGAALIGGIVALAVKK